MLKTRTAPDGLVEGWTRGTTLELTRCLRRSYRVDLMAPGQRCLLWLSGQQEPGVQAVGTLTAAAEDTTPEDMTLEDTTTESTTTESTASMAEVSIRVSMHLLTEPVARSELLADPVFRRAEVLRMPAGSNPSFLSGATWDALQSFLSPGDLRQSGW